MTGWWKRVRRSLDVDPRDVGCDMTIAALPGYVELLTTGGDVVARFPGVLAHLDVCDACAELARGLSFAMWSSRPSP